MLGVIDSTALLLAQGGTPVASNGVPAAQAWVSLNDAKRYAESWSSAGDRFKARMPQARWAETVQPVREPLEGLISRSARKVSNATSLPGAPDGDYEVVEFATHFGAKAEAVETVVLAHEGGTWKVDGYFIR